MVNNVQVTHSKEGYLTLKTTIKEFDKERELLFLRASLAERLKDGENFPPMLKMWKNGKQILTIHCRPLNTNTSEKAIRADQQEAFMEMCSPIMCIDPDHVIFSSDSHFDIRDKNEGMPKIRDLKEYGLTALFCLFVSKHAGDFTLLDPYFKDKENEIWWINMPDYSIMEGTDIGNVDGEKYIDPVHTYITRMYASVGQFPFPTAHLFDFLSDMGHGIQVENNYQVV